MLHGRALVFRTAGTRHRLIPKMKAGMLVAIADDDDQQEPVWNEGAVGSSNLAGKAVERAVFWHDRHGPGVPLMTSRR